MSNFIKIGDSSLKDNYRGLYANLRRANHFLFDQSMLNYFTTQSRGGELAALATTFLIASAIPSTATETST